MDSSKHVFLCTPECNVSHSNMLLALCNCPNSNRPDDLAPLRRAIDMNVRKGWDLHSDVPDFQTEFQFPLVHWACVLGKSKILEWMLSKQSFEAGVTKDETGETGLHRAVACFYNIKKGTKENVSRRVSNFDQVVTVLTEQDPELLFKTENKGNTALHYSADYAICSDMSDKERAFFHHSFTFLLQRVAVLVFHNKLARNSLRNVLGAKNLDGNTVLHILARSNTSSKIVKQVLLHYKDSISARVQNNKGQAPADVAVEFKADLLVTHFKAFFRNGASDPVDSEELTQGTSNTQHFAEGDETRVSGSLRNVQDSSEEVPLSFRRAINLRAIVEFDRMAIIPVHLGCQGRTGGQSDESEKSFHDRASPVRVVPVTSDVFQRPICCPARSDVSRTIPAVTQDVAQSLPAHDIDTSRQFTCHGDRERLFHDEEFLEDDKSNIYRVQGAVQGMPACSADVPAEESGARAASFPEGRAWEEIGEMTSRKDVGHVRQREESDRLGTPTSSVLSLDHSLDIASLLGKKLEQIKAATEELRGELGDTESRERVAGCELRLLESDLQEVQTEREAHEQKKRELLEELNRKDKEILEREDSIKKQIEDKEKVVEDLKCQTGTLTEEVERLKRKCNSYMDVLDDCSVAEDSPPRKRLVWNC